MGQTVQWRCQANWGTDGRTQSHNLANMTEPSTRGGDAALCQITLITSSKCYKAFLTGQKLLLTATMSKEGIMVNKQQQTQKS